MYSVVGIVAFLLASSPTGEQAHRLDFTSRIQNLSLHEMHFLEQPNNRVEVCSEPHGEIRYGRVPYRVSDEEPTSTWNYIQFLVTYVSNRLDTVLFDFNRDLFLACDEQLTTQEHARYPGQVFRTVRLHWQGTDQSTRYRLILPKDLTDADVNLYRIELVDVPTTEWKVGDASSLWMLLDGNANGVIDTKFQDGVLIDIDGDRSVDVNPYGDNFHSFNEPIDLPWGTYRVAEVDSSGQFIRVERLSASEQEKNRVLAAGDLAPSLSCHSSEGAEIPIGGGRPGQHQLLYFWLSSCGSCWEDMEVLNPLVTEMGTHLSAVGISLDGERGEFEMFVAMTNPTWPQCFEGNALWENSLAKTFGVRTGSDFVLIAPSGEVLVLGNGTDSLQEAFQGLFPKPVGDSVKEQAVVQPLP